MRLTARLLCLSILAMSTACVHAQSPAPAPAGQRPLVVVVHGRGQLGRDTVLLKRGWLGALNGGAIKLTGDTLLHDDDLRLVWYADVLDPRNEESCVSLASNPGSRKQWEQRGEAQSFWDIARGALGAVVDLIEGSERLQARGVVGDLLFLADTRKRCGAERRLERVLIDAAREKRPVVLVAHSMGSLMAYDFLRGYAPPDSIPTADIRRVVSLGSMLGMREIEELLFDTHDGRIPLPASVRSWVNVHDRDDPLSGPLRSSMQMREGTELLDIETVTNGGEDVHEIVNYLRTPEAARAVLEAWCGAFAASSRPALCTKID